MKHGSGIKDRDDRSSGVEILMTDVFAKINPTDPLRLHKQVRATSVIVSLLTPPGEWRFSTQS
jgi:hypothetical protein